MGLKILRKNDSYLSDDRTHKIETVYFSSGTPYDGNGYGGATVKARGEYIQSKQRGGPKPPDPNAEIWGVTCDESPVPDKANWKSYGPFTKSAAIAFAQQKVKEGIERTKGANARMGDY